MKQEIISAIVLLILDFMWLGLFMGNKYKTMILDIQGVEMTTRIQYAIPAYILMVIGLILFVIPNIRKEHLLRDSLLYGATFGIVVYGIYDFTAAAVIERWDMKLALLDIAWGGFVFFCAALVGGYFS